MTNQEKVLYDLILEELGNMGGVEIRSAVFGRGPMYDILTSEWLGEIGVRYKTETRSFLGGLFKRDKPLASLDDIRDVLAENSKIGLPEEMGKKHLVYQSFLGAVPMTIYFRESGYESPPCVKIYEKVTIWEDRS